MVDAVLLVISLPIFALACALWAVVGFESARKMGYRTPGAAFVVLIGGCAGLLATAIRHPHNSTGYTFFIDFFWLTWLSAVAATAIVLLALPRRQARTFGNRKPGFPFVRSGRLLIALAWVLFAVTLAWRVRGSIDSTQLASGLAIAVGLLAPTGSYLVRKGLRAEADASADPEAIEALDHPVLYLRAFNQERQSFFIGSAAEYGALARGWHATASRPEQNVNVTFEEYFAAAVRQPLGPLVALGSPEDYLAPEGAARLYAKDSDWMQHIDVLMRRARCILVEVGASAHLRWEFEQIRKEGLHQKLFVITRPSTEGKWAAWAFWRLVWRIQGIPSVPFREFVASLAPLGYEFGDLEPGPGSVIAFDADGQALLLTTGAAAPVEFVAPIQDWTREHRLSGRVVPAACPRCGRRIFQVHGEAAAPPRECRDCRYGPPWKRTWTRIAARVYVVLWVFGGLIGIPFLLLLASPRGSIVDRHIDWVVGASAILSFVWLVRVLGRLDDPPPLRDPDPNGKGKAAAETSRRPGKARHGA